MKNYDQKEKRMLFYLILVFVIFATGIVISGRIYFESYKKKFRAEIDNKLHSITDLKINQIVQWRKERLGDASIFFRNEIFSEYVKKFNINSKDAENNRKIFIWFKQFQEGFEYNTVSLLDTNLINQISFPDSQEPGKSFITPCISLHSPYRRKLSIAK